MNTPKFNVDGSRVYGDGKSYNCTNKITATELCNLLNTYDRTATEYHEIEDKLDKIQKSVIQIQMTTSILSEELKKLHEATL